MCEMPEYVQMTDERTDGRTDERTNAQKQLAVGCRQPTANANGWLVGCLPLHNFVCQLFATQRDAPTQRTDAMKRGTTNVELHTYGIQLSTFLK